MKKLLTLGGLALVGLALLLFSNMPSSNSASADAREKTVLFGKVDLSDDEDNTETEETSDKATDTDHDGSWLENIIKTHKTPFSKNIKK